MNNDNVTVDVKTFIHWVFFFIICLLRGDFETKKNPF